jgi:predicted transglutaminase-like cysteine proteinase
MFSCVAARSGAVLLVLLPTVLAGAMSASAQDQGTAGPSDVATFDSRFSAVNDPIARPAPPTDYQPDHAMPPPAPAEPFGLRVESVTTGGVLNKWNGVVADIRAEGEILANCRIDAQHCPPPARKFLNVIAEGRAHVGRARIGVINRAINLAIRPMSDLAQWGVLDRWSAPLATLTTGRGDCEDYAIAKYVALREAGVAESELRLIIVRDLGNGEDHAVVTAHVDDKWIVLDNRRLTMIEDVAMSRVLPLFAFDQQGVKRFTPDVAEARRTPAPAETSPLAPSAL